MLSDSQIKLANITLQKVKFGAIGQTVIVNGRIATNEKRTEVISSRIAGRIDRLYRKIAGEKINAGDPLYELYSEELTTLQQEYLLAKQQYEKLGANEKRYRSYVDAARKKLLLYGLNDNQIREIAKNNVVKLTIMFSSPISGVVTEVNINEGQYVSEGTQVMKIDDLQSLWVEAELYPAETSLVSIGDTIQVNIPGTAEKTDATVTFLSPEYRNDSFITTMRASLENGDQQLAPGMFAELTLTHSIKKGLTVPAQAVIRDKNGSHVYVKRGTNTFEPMTVETGIENSEKIEIIKGLTSNDTIAASGAYLLYSELILNNGSISHEGHVHENNQ